MQNMPTNLVDRILPSSTLLAEYLLASDAEFLLDALKKDSLVQRLRAEFTITELCQFVSESGSKGVKRSLSELVLAYAAFLAIVQANVLQRGDLLDLVFKSKLRWAAAIFNIESTALASTSFVELSVPRILDAKVRSFTSKSNTEIVSLQ